MCVLLQSLLIPAQRIKDRSHFHLNSGASSDGLGGGIGRPSWLALAPGQGMAHAIFAPRVEGHDESVPHQHAALQDHDHGARADVIYVADGDPRSSAHAVAATKRVLLDQDGFRAAVLPVLVINMARVGYIKSVVPVSTRSELPLERPPRLDA